MNYAIHYNIRGHTDLAYNLLREKKKVLALETLGEPSAKQSPKVIKDAQATDNQNTSNPERKQPEGEPSISQAEDNGPSNIAQNADNVMDELNELINAMRSDMQAETKKQEDKTDRMLAEIMGNDSTVCPITTSLARCRLSSLTCAKK